MATKRDELAKQKAELAKQPTQQVNSQQNAGNSTNKPKKKKKKNKSNLTAAAAAAAAAATISSTTLSDSTSSASSGKSDKSEEEDFDLAEAVLNAEAPTAHKPKTKAAMAAAIASNPDSSSVPVPSNASSDANQPTTMEAMTESILAQVVRR